MAVIAGLARIAGVATARQALAEVRREHAVAAAQPSRVGADRVDTRLLAVGVILEQIVEPLTHIVWRGPQFDQRVAGPALVAQPSPILPVQQFALKFIGCAADWLGDFMVFLRCNEWHHRLAILPGPPCLNHVAYDMISVDDMMRGIGRLRRHEIDLRWGPGRHTAGNNTFSYFVTPNGFTVEYTADLDQVGEDWQPTVYKPSPTIMDQWGIGTGGPHTLPRPQPDPGLFKAVEL